MRAGIASLTAALLVLTAIPAADAVEAPGPTTTTVPTTAAAPPTAPDEPVVESPGPETPTTTAPVEEPPPDSTPPPATLVLGRSRFSPNRDGRFDELPVRVDVAEPSTITVTVLREGRTMAVLAQDRSVEPGTTNLTWSGVADWGVRVSDGWIFVRLEATPTAKAAPATLPTEPSSTQVARAVIDTRPPSFVWRRVAPGTITGPGPLNLSFTTGAETGTVAVRFEMIAMNGARARKPAVRLPVGAASQRWAPRRSRGRALVPGHYLLAAVAADTVGNVRISPVRTVLVHRPVRSIPIRRLSAAGNRVALTFDDCNDATAWSRIVRTMARYGAGATYFCNGTNVARYPSLARSTSGQWGSSIGSHSPRHDRMTRFGSFTVAAQLKQDRSTWWRAARTTPNPYFRPPYGSYNNAVLAGAGAAGYRYTVLWDVDPEDWRRPGAGAIAQRVLSRVRGGSIVVLHTLPQTAAALPAILAGLRRRGLRPVSMDEMTHAAHI